MGKPHDWTEKLKIHMHQLVEEGDTVLVVEQHLGTKCADGVIDLGSCGGESSGHNVAEGSPEEFANSPTLHQGKISQNSARSRTIKTFCLSSLAITSTQKIYLVSN